MLLLCLTACTKGPGAPLPAAASAATPTGDDAENVRLVGYNDMQGRYALEVTTKSDPANGNWVYVGNVSSGQGEHGLFNPITKQTEFNGTSILEISDPANPRYVWHIPNPVSAASRSVSVVYDFGPEKRDYLIRSVEAKDRLKFQVFDITDRGTEPSKISLVSEIVGTPPNSCGPGCGGRIINAPKPPEGAGYPVPRAHKGYWSQKSGRYYASANEPGFRSTLLLIWDLNDPKNPKFVGRGWLPGQKLGEAGFQDQYLHHPIVDEPHNRVYGGFRDGSGQLAAWDITDPAKPKIVWSFDTSPPGRGPHTVSPIDYATVPNFDGSSLPRKYAFVTDELGGECEPGAVKSKSYMFDITHESNVMPVATYQVPVGDFCKRGGAFGPHQHAEYVNGELNPFTDKLAWVAYLNAGVRVVDLADPYHLREVGHYIPKGNVPNAAPVQLTDTDIDHRGLVYSSDRSSGSCLTADGSPVAIPGGAPCRGTGLYVFEYIGAKAPAVTSPR
ncbi:MAG: hypothetical protein ABI972_19990 [Acidobacteriota bacterium]